MREKFQKDDFSDTLKEFEELVGENQKDDPEDASMMDAFFNIFHKAGGQKMLGNPNQNQDRKKQLWHYRRL